MAPRFPWNLLGLPQPKKTKSDLSLTSVLSPPPPSNPPWTGGSSSSHLTRASQNPVIATWVHTALQELNWRAASEWTDDRCASTSFSFKTTRKGWANLKLTRSLSTQSHKTPVRILRADPLNQNRRSDNWSDDYVTHGNRNLFVLNDHSGSLRRVSSLHSFGRCSCWYD